MFQSTMLHNWQRNACQVLVSFCNCFFKSKGTGVFGFIKVVYNPFNLFFLYTLDHYTIMFLVSLPLNECEVEVEVDLVLIQTSLLMEVILKNTR